MPLSEFVQMIQSRTQATTPSPVLGQWPKHQLRRDARHQVDDGERNRRGDQACTRPQAGKRGHARRARSTEAAAGEQHMAELTLVAVDRARLFGEWPWKRPAQRKF